MSVNPIIVTGNSMSDRAPRNRTMTCTPEELLELSGTILRVEKAIDYQDLDCQLIGGDFFEIAAFLPNRFIDLLILDPPYSLTKNYNGNYFRRLDKNSYTSWFRRVIELLTPMMKPSATVYVCSDWKTSTLVLPVLEERFFVRNRITWEREKGRGAKRNWKNNTEDIWFCTNSEDYYLLGETARELLDRLAETASGEWVFPGKSGDEPLTKSDLYPFWIKARDAAGIVADARLHDLRHAHASHAVMNGESLHVAGRLLGHRRASTTNRYVHLDDATLSQAAERVASSIEMRLQYTCLDSESKVV